MKTEQIQVNKVVVGDYLIGLDGNPKRITEIAKGMPINTIELRWDNGWQAFRRDTLVERKLTSQH